MLESFDDFIAAFNNRFIENLNRFAKSSLERRLQKFMQSNDIQDFNQLLEHFIQQPEKVIAFTNSIPVKVTDLFRDTEMWSDLLHLLLLQQEKIAEIKALSFGCSTGEECVSLAILLSSLANVNYYVVTGIDNSPEVIETAIQAKFHCKEIEKLSDNEFFKKLNTKKESYFNTSGSFSYVRPELLNRISYLSGNESALLSHEKYNLILLRNVLIYYQPEYQKHIVERVIERLHLGGLLVLGMRESLVRLNLSDKMQLLSEKSRIYRKVAD